MEPLHPVLREQHGLLQQHPCAAQHGWSRDDATARGHFHTAASHDHIYITVEGRQLLVAAQCTQNLSCIDPATGNTIWQADLNTMFESPGGSVGTAAHNTREVGGVPGGSAGSVEPFLSSLFVLPSRGCMLFMNCTGAMALWHIATGQHIMSTCVPLMSDYAEDVVGVVLEATLGATVHEWDLNTDPTSQLPWNTKSKVTRNFHASVCILSSQVNTLFGVDLLSTPGRLQLPPAQTTERPGHCNPTKVSTHRGVPSASIIVRPAWVSRGGQEPVPPSACTCSPEGALAMAKYGGRMQMWNSTNEAAHVAKLNGGTASLQLIRWERTAASDASVPEGPVPLEAQLCIEQAADQDDGHIDMQALNVLTSVQTPGMDALFTFHSNSIVRRWSVTTGALLCVQ